MYIIQIFIKIQNKKYKENIVEKIIKSPEAF